MARKKLAEEIVPVPIPPRYEAMAVQDNGVRENQTMEALAKLKPYFDRKFGTRDGRQFLADHRRRRGDASS